MSKLHNLRRDFDKMEDLFFFFILRQSDSARVDLSSKTVSNFVVFPCMITSNVRVVCILIRIRTVSFRKWTFSESYSHPRKKQKRKKSRGRLANLKGSRRTKRTQTQLSWNCLVLGQSTAYCILSCWSLCHFAGKINFREQIFFPITTWAVCTT